MAGKLITFEGTEGCGKSTQIDLLEAALLRHSIPVIKLREPGGTPLCEKIRDLLKHDPTGFKMTAETELLLFTASRAELVRQRILPALKGGTWVLCDRYLDSTLVYQGYARGLPLETLDVINRFAVADRLPDLTLVLDLESKESHRRVKSRAKASKTVDRLEKQPKKFFEKVVSGYHKLAVEQSERVKIVDASGYKEDVHQRIIKEIQNALHLRLD